MLCGEGAIVNTSRHAAQAVTLKCRAWTCEDCAPMRRKQLAALAASGLPTTFITLTSNPRIGTTPAARARALVIAWRAVVKRIKKHYGYKEVSYFAVFEATKRGEPHLHILARVGWIEQHWLSTQMDELTSSPIVDIRRVRSAGQAAAYVSKYVGKSPHRFDTCKRYWYTRGWDQSGWSYEPRYAPPGDRWEITRLSVSRVVEDWMRRGWQAFEREGVWYAWDPWGPMQ